MAGPLDEVLQEKVVRALFAIAQLELQPVQRQPRLPVDDRVRGAGRTCSFRSPCRCQCHCCLLMRGRDDRGPLRTAAGRGRAQYLLAMGSFSAGNSEMICGPFGVRMTSSSMRAAEMPSVAGQ